MLQQKDVLPVFSIILDVKKCKSQENYLKLLIPLNLKKKMEHGPDNSKFFYVPEIWKQFKIIKVF